MPGLPALPCLLVAAAAFAPSLARGRILALGVEVGFVVRRAHVGGPLCRRVQLAGHVVVVEEGLRSQLGLVVRVGGRYSLPG